MTLKSLRLSTLFLILLAGCSSLGLEPAQTLNQKIAYAYGTHMAVLQAATAAVNTGSLKSGDAQQVLQMADQAKLFLDGATSLAAAGDPNGATNKLALATGALTALQQYLNTHTGAH